MKKNNVYTVLLLTIPLLFMFSGICFGEELVDQKNNLIQKIHQGYIDSAMAYGSIFVDYALNLFWWLVLIDLLYHLIMFWKTGDGELDQLLTMFMFRIIYAGFFWLILDKGADIGSFIYDTVVNDFARKMIDAGISATGGATLGPSQISPSDFLDIGFSICFAITEKAGFWSRTGLMTSLVAVLLMILFMLIIAEILVAMVEYYMVCSIGYFLLAFGGLTATQSMVWSYFKTLFAMSFKIMAIYAVTSIAFGFIHEVAGTAAQREAIVGDTESLLVLLAGVCLFAILVRKVPERLTAVITGAMFNGSVNAGGSSMVKSVLAASAGAAVGAGAVTASGGAAVSSAVGLAKAQGAVAATTGSGGSGGSVDGSPQKMNTAMSTTGRILKNLTNAAVHTAVEKGAKGSNTFANVGGTMANHMNKEGGRINATEAINNAGAYTPPSEKDLKNTVKGEGKS